MTINIAGASSVPDLRALAGSFADLSLTINIPIIEATKPIEARAKGNIIKFAEAED
jgi:hypothetical protein